MKVSRTTLVGMALGIFVATAWLYWPSVRGGFLTSMDDQEELEQSVRLNGLTWNAVKWAFTATEPDYYPVQRLTHVLDYQIWGKNAAGHHATSVVLHALNAALVFGFLWTLLGKTSLTTGERLAMTLGVAVVFAVHPFHTEPVAWMSCRTHLLATTFGIGCLWAYVVGARRWVVGGLYVVALLCSPMAVPFPFVMLALDYFPLRRHEQLGWGRLLREKVLWIGFGGVLAAATMMTESRKGGMMLPLEAIPPYQRVLLMFQSLAFYPWKLIWPSGLAPYYPLPLRISLGQPLTFASVLCVSAVTALAVRERRRLPALATGWGAYVILVLPVSGLMQRSTQAVALRYAYLAMLPLSLLAGGALIWAWRRSTTVAQAGLVGLLTCEVCAFGVLTRRLIPVWHDDETLWRRVLSEFPDSPVANPVMAKKLLQEGKAREALEYAQRETELVPQSCEAHQTLGLVLDRLGRTQEAFAQFEQALRIKPDYVEAHNNFGNALEQAGRVAEAIDQYQQALRIKPNYPEAHLNLGIALVQMGRRDDGIREYEETLRIKPDYAEAHNNLGNALEQAGRVGEAIDHYEQALRINPDYAEAHVNLGNALGRMGKVDEAVAQYEQALTIKPGYVEARNNLGAVFQRMGKLPEAVQQYQQVLRTNPDYAEAHSNLGAAFQRMGKFAEAAQQYEQALRSRPDYVEAHFNLGLVLEKLGRTPEAIEHYQQALKIRPDFTPAKNALTRLGAGP